MRAYARALCTRVSGGSKPFKWNLAKASLQTLPPEKAKMEHSRVAEPNTRARIMPMRACVCRKG